MPPLTPRTMFMSSQFAVGSSRSLLRTANRDLRNLFSALQRRRLLHRRCELPLHLILLDLFHGHARGFGVFRLHLGVSALNDLLCTFRDEQHIAKLAVNALGQSFHLVPP